MKKLLAMLGATGLVVSTGAILVSCNEKEAPKAEPTELKIEDGKVDFKEEAEVSSIVMTKVTTKAAPDAPVTGIELKEGFSLNDTNTTLIGTLLIADGVEPGVYEATFTADRKAKDEVSKAEEVEPLSATYTFTVEAKEVALSTVITKTELGILDKKEEASIIAAVKAENPAAEKLELKVAPEFTDKTATITAKGYTGEVVVTYTIKGETPTDPETLDSVIETKDFKDLTDDKPATIIKAVKEVNTKVADDSTLQIEGEVAEGKAVLKSDKFSGNVNITFTVKKATLDSVIETKDFKDLADDKPATIIKAVKEVNTKVADDSTLQIEGEVAEGKAVLKSDKFSGNVNITFTVKTTEG